MADQDVKKESRWVGMLAWLTAIAAAILAIPQQMLPELVRDGLKGAWGLARVGRALTAEGIELAMEWLKKHGSRFVWFVIFWIALSTTLMCVGILLRGYGSPDIGRLIGVIGAIVLQMLYLFLAIFAGALVNVLFIVTGKFERFMSDSASRQQIKQRSEEAHKKWRDSISAGLVLAAGLLLPFQLFVSWQALVATVLIWGALLPAIFGVVHLGGSFGVGIKIIIAASLGLAALILSGLLLSVFMPEFYASLRIRDVGIWLTTWTPTGWFLAFLAFFLIAWTFAALLAKDKERRLVLLHALKYLVPIALVVTAFLVIRGTLPFEDVFGREWPWSKKSGEEVATTDSPTGQPMPAVGSGSYPPPPSGVLPSGPPPASTPAPRQRFVASTPLPPKPAAPDYTNDPGAAIRDLEALGY